MRSLDSRAAAVAFSRALLKSAPAHSPCRGRLTGRRAMRGAEAVGADVASAVLRRYASLGKNGKPQPGEYTLLAGFAVTDGDGPPRVVAIGTGTKCLPAESRCPRGEALADSHAEVIARRALLRFAYDELDRLVATDRPAGSDPPPIFERDPRADASDANATQPRAPFRLRPGIRLHLYCSQSPCGDASIFPGSPRVPDAAVPDAARPEAPPASKRAKTTGAGGGGAGVTGAKLLRSDRADADAEFGVESQTVGAARLKPGRGPPTSCMSCSDKMARWARLGAQGGLLSAVLATPLRIETVVVAAPGDGDGVPIPGDGEAPYLSALRRALVTRVESTSERLAAPFGGADATTPSVVAASPPPPELSGVAGQRRGWVACGTSINWSADREGTVEVTLGATGRKAGFAKRDRDSPKATSRVCRASLASRFVHLRRAFSSDRSADGRTTFDAIDIDEPRPYAAVKRAAGSSGYDDARDALLRSPSPLSAWSRKDPARFAAFPVPAPDGDQRRVSGVPSPKKNEPDIEDS